MSRVPLGTAAAIGEVDKATIRQWVYRGHINRYQDGDPNGEYESTEVFLWVEQIRPRDESGRFITATPGTSRLLNV